MEHANASAIHVDAPPEVVSEIISQPEHVRGRWDGVLARVGLVHATTVQAAASR